MSISLATFLFAINFLQTCWIIGYKRYFSLRQASILTSYLLVLSFIDYWDGTYFSFILLIPFILIESAFILYFTKSWALTAFYSLIKNMMLMISWLLTWEFVYILKIKDIISPIQFSYLKPLSIFSQQLLLFLSLILIRKISNKYAIFKSISQLQKKYIIPSIFCFVLLYSFNIIREASILRYQIFPFFQLTVGLLVFEVCFTYIVYLISRFYQQQTQIYLLSKKNERDSENIDLANEFKHDYRNILLSLNTYLEQKEFEQASEYLSSIINYSKSLTEINYYTQISTINIQAVQGVLLNFFEECSKQNIPVQFFTNQRISYFDLNIVLIDFIRCLSILLDNALEASTEIENPLIQLTIIRKNDTIFVEVKNKSDTPVAIENIFKNNFTTKKEHQGKGIPIFVKLLKQYRKVRYSFSREHGFFIASFTIPVKRR